MRYPRIPSAAAATCTQDNSNCLPVRCVHELWDCPATTTTHNMRYTTIILPISSSSFFFTLRKKQSSSHTIRSINSIYEAYRRWRFMKQLLTCNCMSSSSSSAVSQENNKCVIASVFPRPLTLQIRSSSITYLCYRWLVFSDTSLRFPPLDQYHMLYI